MGLLGVVKKAYKVADGLLDDAVEYAGPLLTDNVTDMTAEQIEMAIKSADELGLPGWRVTDLERHLPIAKEAEEMAALRTQAEDRLNEISSGYTRGHAQPDIVDDHNPLHDIVFGDDFLDGDPWSTDYKPQSIEERINNVVNISDYATAPLPKEATPQLSASSDGFDVLSSYNRRGIRAAPWANQEEIRKFKTLARQLEEATGVAMDVDHYIPLQGDFVSGLHHQDNLFVMPASQNRTKGNRFDYKEFSEMPDSAFRLTDAEDSAKFLEQNKALVKARQDKKFDIAKEMSSALNHQILDPRTKIGRNARALWGSDAEKYLGDIKWEMSLLGLQ